ncbi:hypothetical protein Tco_0819540 [Tanacetum coccineum]|uniref:Uncharacterized protein n=1 Tax=Tanacetum coccineum TaxID=301880 RepID=A0ABQ5A6V3_9ASTR
MKIYKGKQVDATLYHGMIGSLMYLTSSRPDLIYAFCLCAQYQMPTTLDVRKLDVVHQEALSSYVTNLLAGRPKIKRALSSRIYLLDQKARYEKHFSGNIETFGRGNGRVMVEKRLEIRKCNRRLNPRKIQRKPTFQVVLDVLALTPCYSAFLIIADVPEVYMHQFWDSVYKHDILYRFKMDKMKRFKLTLEIFKDISKICPRVQGQDFDALPTDEYIVSFLRELRHTKEINSLNDVIVDQMHQPWRTFASIINRSLSGKTTSLDKLRLSGAQIHWEATQIYGVILPESLTSLEMKETKAYKTYLGFATGATPPKITRKFKKAYPSKKDLNLNLVLVDEEPKSAKKKVSTKKTTKKQSIGLVLRDTHVETSSKRKERKSLRDFHKTHPSGFGTVTKTAPSAAKIKPFVTNEGTGVKPGVPDVIEEESTENDEEEEEDEFVKTLSIDTYNEDETKITDKAKGDEDEEMDYTTSQLCDDVDIRLNKPVQADDETVQKSTIIPQSIPSFTPPPPQSTPTPPPTTEATNLPCTLPNFASVFQFDNRVIALEKEVAELKRNDPLNTQVTALLDEHLDSRLGATKDELMNYLSASITTRITKQVKNQLPQILPIFRIHFDIQTKSLPLLFWIHPRRNYLEEPFTHKEEMAPMASSDPENLKFFSLRKLLYFKEYELGLLRTELEKITDKSKKGIGYNAVPSPHPLILNRPTTRSEERRVGKECAEFFSSRRRRHTRYWNVTGVQTCALPI